MTKVQFLVMTTEIEIQETRCRSPMMVPKFGNEKDFIAAIRVNTVVFGVN